MVDYFLPHHVHYCRRGDALIFLDLRRDDYTMVSGNSATAVWLLSSSQQTEESRGGLADSLKELLEGGLLTTDPSAGRDIAPTRVELALESLVDPETIPEMHVTTAHVWHFLAACTIVAVRLHRDRLEDTVKAVAQRKARHSASKPINMENARELTAIFQKLRSLFPINFLCLYDSLALIQFLASYCIFPMWVFAVKLEPWAAHCWVQEARFTFNEGPEEAASYTPVMVI